MLEVYALVIGSFPTARVDCSKLPMRYREDEGRLNDLRFCLEINLSFPAGLNRIYFRSCNFSWFIQVRLVSLHSLDVV